MPANPDLLVVLGDSICIKIDNEAILTGFVERIKHQRNSSGRNIIITGRDRLCDFIDSRISNKTFSPPVQFETILTRLLTIVGFNVVKSKGINSLFPMKLGNNNISIINNVGLIPIFTANEGISYPPGESAYEMIKKLADKRELLLGTDGLGNIVIDKIGVKKAKTDLVCLSEGGNINNILESDFDNTTVDRFYEYEIASFLNASPTAELDQTKLSRLGSALVKYSKKVYDEDIRKTRKFYGVCPNLNSIQIADRAKWEVNIRKAKDFIYICKVSGFRQNLTSVDGNFAAGLQLNPLWETNTTVFLNDEENDISDNYLIRSVRYTQNANEGSKTELTLVDGYAYTKSTYKPLILRGKKGNGNGGLKPLLDVKKPV